MKWSPPPDRPSLKTSEFYGLPYRREIAALRRAGFDRVTARYLMAARAIDCAHQIVCETPLRLPEDMPRDEVLEHQANIACVDARKKVEELMLYHLHDVVASVIDAADRRSAT